MTLIRVSALLPSILLAMVCQLDAQSPGADSPSIRLYGEILGTYSWPITTQSSDVQAYFDQGVRLMYAYSPAAARRSFEEARRRDPMCAMCWWGEAWSAGPYLNGGMRDADVPAAFAAINRARDPAASVTPVERALIEAMGTRYSATPAVDGRGGLDSAYVEAMARVYDRFPEHDEVGTLYADALMLLEPRRGTWSVTKPAVARIHAVLEGVLARNLGHPGACHAYVHATETTPKVIDAQACADLLGASIPGASHINHMPSHTYNRVGRWGDATTANIQAWHSDLRAQKDEGFAIYPAHNLHMLLFSASMDGQGAIAIQAAKDYGKLAPADGASFQALTLVRFGRFGEVLALEESPANPIHRGLWAFARGLAQLRLGEPDSARFHLDHIDSLAAHTPATRMFRVHRPASILGIVAGILRGELFRSEGRIAEAVVALQEASNLEAGLTYDEPEPLPFMVRDFLGALLLESGRPAEAERVYQEALEARPRNGWSLVGLEQALRAQGRTIEADEARARFQQAWARSEVWVTGSRF